MTKVKDALNQEYVFTYDPLGRQLSRTRAGYTETFVYDSVGNRTQRTDFNGRITDYTYDNLNRVTGMLSEEHTTNFANFTYDDLSRLETAENQTGTVSFTYDNRGRLESETDVFGRLLEFGYDDAGRRTSLSLDSNTHSTYGYDNANRLTTLTDDASNNWTFAYDNADRLTSKTLPNGIVLSFEYDGMSRLKRLKHVKSTTTLYDDQYTYNSANQISQIAGLTQTKNFTYDDVNRLTGMTDGTATESYTYDAVGNRTASHLNTYTIGTFNQVSASGPFAISYDNNGNMLSWVDPAGELNAEGDTWGERGWDFENRLTLIDVDGEEATYAYDALGRRVSRTFDGREARFTYDGQDVIKDDDDSSGMTTYQNAPGIDNKLKLTTSSDTSYFLQDHLGSTVGLANTTGTVTEQNSYDSFGNPTNSSFSSRYQFTGRELDSFTGLQHNRARWYHPNLGRFISEDPIGFEGGDVNLYAYVKNIPIKYNDPLGLLDPIIYQDPKIYGQVDPAQIERINACYQKWKFSSVASFGNSTAGSILEFVEIGSVSSLTLDSAAMARKAMGPRTFSSNAYASGINMLGKDVSRATGYPGIFRFVRPIGDKVTPVLAITGAFTLSYNLTTDIQCACGIID